MTLQCWRPVLPGILLLVCGTVLAEPEIARYLAVSPDQSFSLSREVSTPEEAAQAGTFGSVLLEEAELYSLSQWTGNLGTTSVRLDVYETLSSMGAYSLFHRMRLSDAARDARVLDVALGNAFKPGLCFFWRGPFFMVLRPAAGELRAQACEGLMRRLEEGIEMVNLLPLTVSHLPEEGMEPDSMRFYMGGGSLAENEEFPRVLLSEIGRAKEVEIAFARFGDQGDSLFLIGYPTVALAQEYSVRLQQRMEEFFSPRGLYLKRTGMLICLFQGPEDRATELLSRINYKATVQWLRDRRDPLKEHVTFFGLLTKTILGTGVFILLIIAGGVVVGFGRYEFIRRFPAVYRRNEMTRLNLD